MARTSGDDDLFKLIHALTPEEKGYFKKFSTRHSAAGNTYLKIFNDIDRQTSFSEATLKARYKSYTTQKVYLFDSVIESLMIYQRQREGKYNPHYNTIYYYILLRKNLLRKAEQEAEKTLKMVTEEEWFPMQIQFLEYKLSAGKRKWKKDEWWKNCVAILDEIDSTRLKEINRDKHSRIFHTLFYMQMRMAEDKEFKPQPAKEIDIAFLKNKKNSLSSITDRVRLFSLSIYYELTADLHGMCDVNKEVYDFEIFLLAQKNLKTNVRNLSASLRGLLQSYIQAGETEKAWKLFSKDWVLGKNTAPGVFDNFIHGHKYESFENYIDYCQYHSLLCWHMDDFKRGLDFLIKESARMDNPALKEPCQLQFYDIWKCRILFEYRSNKFQAAMISITELERMNIKKESPALFKDCQWMQVGIQLRMKNYEIVQNLCRNMAKKEAGSKFNGFEKLCISELKKISYVNAAPILRKIKLLNNTVSNGNKIFGMIELKDLLAKP